MTEYRGFDEFNSLIHSRQYRNDAEAVEVFSSDEEVVRITAGHGDTVGSLRGYVTIWTRDHGATREEEQMKRENEAQRECADPYKPRHWDDVTVAASKPVITEEEVTKMRVKIKEAEAAAEDFYTAVNRIEHELIVQFYEPHQGLQPVSVGVSKAILQAKQEAVDLQTQLGTVGTR